MRVFDMTEITARPGGVVPNTIRSPMMYDHAYLGAYGAGIFPGDEYTRVRALPESAVDERLEFVPTHAHLSTVVQRVRTTHLVIHTELYNSWTPDRDVDRRRHSREFANNGMIAETIQFLRPDLQVGVWNATPHGWNDGAGPNLDGRFIEQLRDCMHLTLSRIHFLADGYGVQADVSLWRSWARFKLAATINLGVPLIPVFNVGNDIELIKFAITGFPLAGIGVWGEPEKPYNAAWWKKLVDMVAPY